MKVDKLLPCPFCGEAEAEEIKERDDEGALFRYVRCSYCGARGPWGVFRETVIEAWNRRKGA